MRYALRIEVGAAGGVLPDMATKGQAPRIFDLLQPAQRTALEQRAHAIRFRKGQTIIQHSSDSSDVFFLVDGEVRVLLFSPDGREVSVRTLGSGQMFGELAAIDGLPRSATVVAVASSLVIKMKSEDFKSCIANSAHAALWFAQELTGQIRSLTDKIFELSSLNVRSRVHCELLRLVAATGGTGNEVIISPSPTHSELANRIGTHREAVTRELSALSKRRIIEQGRRKIHVRDIAALKKMVGRTSPETIDIFPATATSSLSRPLLRSTIAI